MHQCPGEGIFIGHFEAIDGGDKARRPQRAQEGSQRRGDSVGEVHGIDAAEEHGPKGDHKAIGEEPSEVQKRLAAQGDEADLGLGGQPGIERVAVGLDAADGGRVAAGEEEDARAMGHSGT